MTKQVITVSETTPLSGAVMLITKNGFDGLPIVDSGGHLVGMLNEQKLLANASYVHLKTLLIMFSGLDYYKEKKAVILQELNNTLEMQVKNFMNSNAVSVKLSDSIEHLRSLFSDPSIFSPLPVVDNNKVVRGIVSRSDLSKYYTGINLAPTGEKYLNPAIDTFAAKFAKEFMVVPRFRVYTWIITSIIFGLAGFAVALFFILRINA